MNRRYSHVNALSDISPLILAINIMGENLHGLELGVAKGESFMTILHNCKNVKSLIGVDSWKSHTDFLKEEPDGLPAYTVDEKESEFNKMMTHLHIKYDSPDGKEISIIEKDSLEAVNDIPDESLDFIFFDAMMSKEQTFNEALAYYPKIKKGGFFTGHDALVIRQVMKPIEDVKNKFKNTNPLIVFLDLG